jgi:HEPN domain-containing protein
MRPETAEWVEKAEGDFRTAGREKNSAEHPNYDAACFHAQQCAEKYLKARLVDILIKDNNIKICGWLISIIIK